MFPKQLIHRPVVDADGGPDRGSHGRDNQHEVARHREALRQSQAERRETQFTLWLISIYDTHYGHTSRVLLVGVISPCGEIPHQGRLWRTPSPRLSSSSSWRT